MRRGRRRTGCGTCLTENDLRQAIGSLLGPEPRRRAAALAAEPRAEDGTAFAANAVEKRSIAA